MFTAKPFPYPNLTEPAEAHPLNEIDLGHFGVAV